MVHGLSYEAKLRRYLGLGFLLLLTACQVFQPEDTQATAQAAVNAYSTEGASIQATLSAAETQVIATGYAAETQIFDRDNTNRILLATVRAEIPPTQPVVAITLGDAGQVVPSLENGELLFATTGIATAVRPEDDCIQNLVGRVSTASSRVYATAVGSNVHVGTKMSAEWMFENTLVWSDTWDIPRDFDHLCFWFSLQPSEVPFTPGNWSVRLFANGTPIGQPMSFVMVDVMDNMNEG